MNASFQLKGKVTLNSFPFSFLWVCTFLCLNVLMVLLRLTNLKIHANLSGLVNTGFVFTMPTHSSHDHSCISGIDDSPANLKSDITKTVVQFF